MSVTTLPGLVIDLERIAETCRAYHVRSLDLFGSATTDRFDPERSDVDLLVVFDNREALGQGFFDFHRELETLVGRKVDLITETALRNPYFRRQVERQLRRIYPPNGE